MVQKYSVPPSHEREPVFIVKNNLVMRFDA